MDLLDRLAALLLVIMPFTFLAKSVAIAVTVGILRDQDPVDRIGRLVLWFFIFLFFTSAGLTGMFGALAIAFHDETDLGEWLWWMVIVEVFSTLTAWAGLRMTREEVGSGQGEDE